LQFNFSQQDITLSPVLILVAMMLSNVILILLLSRFLSNYGEQFSTPILNTDFSLKLTFSVLMVVIAFLLFVQYEIVTWWTQIFGQITVNLIPWPFHQFEPEKFEISYLILFTLIFIFIQPLWEELLFRRILIGNMLKQGFNHVYAILLSSLSFSLYLALYLLVEITINDLFWFILTNLTSGIALGAIFVFFGQIRHAFLVRSITNVFLLILTLSQIHFEFIPYREFILIISQLILLLGILIVFYKSLLLILDGNLSETLKDISRSIRTLTWPRESQLKSYWYASLFLMPIFPLGVNIFIDHTILYTDLLATILENGLSTIILVICAIILFYSFQADLSLIPINEIKTIILRFKLDAKNSISKKDVSVRSILGGIRARMVFILLLLGVISPFYILSVVSLTKVEIVIVFQTFINLSIFIAQNPCFTYQHIVTEIRSNVVFIGNSIETVDQLFLFSQSIGKWNFLPDTYMSTSADWIHGLLTVVFWFGIIILYIYLLRKSKQYPIKAALGAVLLIVMNFIWLLLAMGLGSISPEGRPSGIPSLEDMSLLVNFDIQIKNFLILPLGLLLFLMAAIIILIGGFKNRRKRQSTFTKS
jgi:hypothetical protein